MTTLYDNIEKLKDFSREVWLITFLVIAFGLRFLKEAIVFILVKLHEFFIQQNSFH